MSRFLAVMVLGVVTTLSFPCASAQSGNNPGIQLGEQPTSPSYNPSVLPPLPKGKSTVIGGAIRSVDQVRDQFKLQVFGGKSMKILFDERTQFYNDGTRTPLRDLHPTAHASVETMLDGTSVFARSIHILSRPPAGESQGQVVSYNSGTGILTVKTALSRQPIELRVPPGTPIVGEDQFTGSGASNLVPNALVSIQFQSSNNGRGVATHVAVLAIPGSTFKFTGNIAYLDLHSNLLVVVDPRDGKSYPISFNPAHFAVSHDLHEGTRITVTTTFDGSRYTANAIQID